MTSRKRNNSSTFISDASRSVRLNRVSKKASRKKRRQSILETLESRQLLAGPQLIGVQPNEGELIVSGTKLDTAPRVLTFRFDENQRIDPSTFEGIQIVRSGVDGQFDTLDDVVIEPGSVSLGESRDNEVVVRFAETLPDDRYRIDVYGFDDAGRDIIGLRNRNGEFLVPRNGVAGAERIDFELRLGAQIEAFVPQPVVRLADGTLQQRRDEILIYFNDDELFVENDPQTGLPTERSAENPRFYQLLLTEETVRTTDDTLYSPDRVIYDAATNTARLIFASDLNRLPGVPAGGGTFRLRVGTAVDNATDLIIEPTKLAMVPRVSSNLGIAADLEVEFVSNVFGESVGNRQIRFTDSGVGGLTARLDSTSGDIVYDFGGQSPTVQQLQNVTESTPAVDAVVSITFSKAGVPGAGGSLVLPAVLIDATPLKMFAAGDTLTTATDVGVFGLEGNMLLSSLVISESISPQSYRVQLPGAPTDPGRAGSLGGANSGLARAINELFGPDVTDGVTEIEYNFQGIFAGGAGTGLPAQLNNITDIQKRRIREAISLWSNYLGIQFRETKSSGITFATGAPSELLPASGTELRDISELNAALRVDPTFEHSAMVFNRQTSFKLNYGEDFFRKAMVGIGFLLGLERNDEVTAQTLMALDPAFLDGTINPDSFVAPADPFVPSQTTFQQSINPNIDSQTIQDPLPNALEGPEPVFPGNQDILHGQLLHRPDSIDVDLYRFEVALQPGLEFGTLTVESFAERLADSSLLDTTLTLYQDRSASATTDFGLGTAVSVSVASQLPGDLGNRSRIEFIQSDRGVGDTGVRINRLFAANGDLVANAIQVDLPRRGPNVTSVTVGQVLDAINGDAFASSLFELELVKGNSNTDISRSSVASYSPIRLSGGGTVPITRNDDYFSSDSLLTTKLSNGVYYIGVAASGNDQYHPSSPESGFGGRTQGDYELLIKFEPQVSKTDVIRDRDSDRVGVPGTALDGDLDGAPGGVSNFWFQTRPLERILDVTSGGSGIVAGQTMTVTSANGVQRNFEFVPVGGSARPGNVAIFYQSASPASEIAVNLASAINTAGVLNVLAETEIDFNTTPETARVKLTGERSLAFSSTFRGVEALGRTLFVDKLGSVVADGSLTQPFNNIDSQFQASAFDAALPGDIVRIVGNGGQDNNISTPADNFSYQIGISEIGGGVLPDGRHMDVPKDVTTMIDGGAVFKLRSSVISVGSNNLLSDRSEGALQVLGVPRLLQLSDPSPVGASTRDVGIVDLGGSGNVVFTSTRDRSVDAAASGNSPNASDGNWGGLIFRRDFDDADGRFNLEDEGIFLQVVNHADIRFGGGSNILINSVQQTVNPIQMVDMRPTVTFNRLTNNASAAMSASPNAFLETRFQEPKFQQAGAFTADYLRVGPDVKQNMVVDNSINGLFIRTERGANQPARQITVAARIDDVDIVHYIAENIVIAGQPGGPIQDGFKPDLSLSGVQTTGGGSLPIGDFQYRIAFVDPSGFESLASDPSPVVTTTASARQVQLLNLPTIPAGSAYLTRRLYRLDPSDGQYRLIAQLNRSNTTFADDGSVSGGAVLDLDREGIRGRLDGSLVIDPNSVVKFRGARLELDHGTQLLAEGTTGKPVIFTSALDDRFGAGGSFDTNDDKDTPGGGALPQRGDWSGIYAGPTANVSLDHSLVAYGGGVSLIEGGQSKGFAALELQQASARVTNSRFEYNDNAQDGSGPVGRNGRLAVTPATIYARYTQPVIVGNQFVDNHGAIIDIDLGSMTDALIVDAGRQTGSVDLIVGLDDNIGPLVRRNSTESVAGDVSGERQLNGMRIRGGELTASSVWDDTDIVHVLFDSVIVGNQVSGGALTLKSRPDESLVVKFAGRGTPNSAAAGTGITATGSTGDIADRIGGTVHVLGLPGAPVVLTSLKDDSVGAGRKTDGTAQNDTNGDSFGSRPASNDWRSLYFDGLSNDRNTAVLLEQELPTAAPPGLNATVNNAQILGDLAERLTASDDLLRLGFEVQGFISAAGDLDTYAFTAAAGTQVWIDLDRTSLGLDAMIEVVDDSGNVIARSDNSFDEVDDPSLIDAFDPDVSVGGLGDSDNPLTKRWASGDYYDVGSTNLRDAGLRIILPGVTGTRSDYFVRVRAASTDPDDVAGGATSGAYTLQVRLQEGQEFPGSVVRFADIRYANNGIHVQGLPGSSPLLGEAQENESADPSSFGSFQSPIPGGFANEGEPRYPTNTYAVNDQINGGFYSPLGVFGRDALNNRPQNLGDLIDTKTGTISVGGSLSAASDVDFYQLDIDRDGSLAGLQRSTTFDIDYADGFDRPDTNLSVFYSPTDNPNSARLILFGESSNVLDDLSNQAGSQQVGELLRRGSISEADPLIGPVALPAGSYFIAVTESGRIPQELVSNPRVRRTPIESGVRIFDDHIEVIGGSTAKAPVHREFIGTTTPGWSVTTDRSSDPGHQRPGSFQLTSAAGSGATLPDAETTASSQPAEFLNPTDFNDPRDSGTHHDTPDVIADSRIILEFKPGVLEFTQASILQQRGLVIDKEFNSIDAIVVTTPNGADSGALIDELNALPEIAFAEPNYEYRLERTPNDPLFSQMWPLNNTGQTGGRFDADIDAPEAWDIFTGSDQVVVAVLDSGIDLVHPDLAANIWVNPGEIAGDGIDNDGNGYIDDINGIDPFDGDVNPTDLDGHGTHVSGTIAAVGDNGIGVTGVNWNAKIMPVRVCGIVVCSGAAILEGIDYVTTMKSNGINIVVSNNSYGGPGASFAIQNAIQANINVGVPFVAAAGNNGSNNDFLPFFPANYDLEGIISVAATDARDQMAFFSNFGAAGVDIAAPGVSVLSTILSAGPGPDYGLSNGTSMASPHVAGVVALLAGLSPTASVLDLKSAVMDGADVLANLTGTSISGARLNAAGAIASLLGNNPLGNQSIRFDRSEEVGLLESNPFDLAGYSAADLPRFYFDYLVDAAPGDSIVVQARSNEQPTAVPLNVTLSAFGGVLSWRQAIVALDQFAGDTGIVVEFLYNTDTTNLTAEGLYLDNFLIGFAERGEAISGAVTGRADFTQTFSGTPGEYQLEIRPATDYSQPISGGVLVERSLEADPRLIDPVYLSFPAGRGIVRYETFTIDVLNLTTGVDETLTFQFQPTEVALRDPSQVDPNAIPVPYSRNSPQSGGFNSVVDSVIAAVSGLQDYAFYNVRETSVELFDSFDTNDRHGDQLTLIAPSGDQLSDGDTFVLGDGSRTSTFEFSTDSQVTFGNIQIPFTPSDSAAVVARRMIEVINSGVVQGSLKLRASTVSGEFDFDNPSIPDNPPTDARVAIVGTAVGNFAAVSGTADAPPAGMPLPVAPDGTIILSAIYHDGAGDLNTLRTQGQVIVENNTITEVHAIGIWSDPGRRGVDLEDDFSPGRVGLGLGNSFLQLPPVGDSPLGAVLNLPRLNDSVEGGLTPGLVAQNNIIDQAGYSGIKVDGETRPFIIEWNGDPFNYFSGNTQLSSRGDILVADGYMFAVDAGGTRVVFEFEDISGAPVALGGSGVAGGDGWVDGHVPIYYRLGQGATYNPSLPAPNRNVGYTAHELMMAIYESIQGSILVTNDKVELVRPTLGPSVTNPVGPEFQTIDTDNPSPIPRQLGDPFLDFSNPAIYLEGVTAIYSSISFQKVIQDPQLNLGYAPEFGGYPISSFDQLTGETNNGPAPMVPIYEAPQPLAKIVNNTIRGADGTEGAILGDGSLSPAIEMPTAEPNDTLAEAVDTKLEVSHRGGYFATGTIGDHVGLLPADQDVDFFKVELSVGDRLIVDIDTPLGMTTLVAGIDDQVDMITVADVSSLPPAAPFDIDVEGEAMTVTAINGNVLTVTRTAGAAHGSGVAVTGPGRPDTSVRVLNEIGVPQVLSVVNGLPETVNTAGIAPSHLNPGSTVANPTMDGGNVFDPFVDFTALATGTYYVAVSSAGNENYDPDNLSGRTTGQGGTGDYSIGIEVLAPRSFVFSLDSHPLTPFGAEVTSGNINGTTADGGPAGARSLIGTTFTISQIPDYLIPTRPGDAYANVNADGNRVTFEYTGGVNAIVLPNGNINIPILPDASIGITGGQRVPDIMRATANAINGYLNNPALPNHEVANGPDGREGPVTRVRAQALGGSYGDNVGIENFTRTVGIPFSIFGGADFTTGFGHDRRESGGSLNIVPDGTFTNSQGTTELYVLIQNAAKIELSPEARAAGLKLGPDNTGLANDRLGNTDYATESDQLLVENGILVSSGVSAAILNNVVVNAHQSIVQEESSVFGFGGRIDSLNRDLSVKQGQVVATGNAYQYDELRNTQMRQNVSWWVVPGVNVVNRNPALDGSLSTDLRTGPSNIAGGNSDFNFVVRQPGTPGQSPGNFITLIGDDLLNDGAAGRFTPAPNAAIIDSAVDSIEPNVDLAAIYELVGIPSQAIFAPRRDHSGQLRADEPTMAPPGGIGANIFKDRGALDRADFVGPIVSLDWPLDNDFERSDFDPSVSFVNRDSGVFTEFRILVQDLGDDSDPFVGSGIDDSTVVVSEIPGLRKPGANLALFENDRLLEEGIEYTFSYDETRGVITLTPLAGIWKSDRSYRIQLNNRDRVVVIAPDPSQVSDGDQVSIVDPSGGTVVFEFESGYSLLVPEAIQLIVPQTGTNAGGLADGDIFRISDGGNPVAVFEFNTGDTTLPGTIPVELPQRPTPTNPADLAVFLQEIVNNMATAIQSVIDDGKLDVDLRILDDRVIVGAEAGTRAITMASGLNQPARTLALQAPATGVGVGGVVDGDTFVINNGNRSVTFEFDSGNGLNNRNSRAVSIVGLSTASDVALAIRDAVEGASLGLTPSIAADNVSVFLDLPVNGSASVGPGQLSVIGLSRTAADGDTIVITPNDGGAPVSLEIDRIDGSSPGVATGNAPIEITRLTTADELAGLVSNSILGLPPISGLTAEDIQVIPGGLLTIGGEKGLGFDVTSASLEVIGEPSVTESSTIEIFGPLLLTLPLVGGGGIRDGSVIVVTNDTGNDVIFEFNLNNTLPAVPGSIPVAFDTFSTVDVIANNLVAAINGANIGVTTQNLGLGRVSFGRIDATRVNIAGIPGQSIPGLAGASLRPGIVQDGEVMTIRQGSVSVSYEFESAVGGGGVGANRVPVVFQPGSTVENVAVALAAAINNNKGGLDISAVVVTDDNGDPTGQVQLLDKPGTVIDVVLAPNLSVTGVPGGATPIRISPAFSAEEVKKAMLSAINSVSDDTSLRVEDRGGATLFVENAVLIEGPVESFYLPSVKDVLDNPLKPNRQDGTTQFTILLPTVGLDFGDAPDPRDLVSGRYPSLLANDGARHVIGPDLMLGTRVDAEPDAQVTANADGDDLVISISSEGALFNTSVGSGFAEITLQPGVDPTTRDQDTITITLADRTVTLEFDVDGIFREENFAIAPLDPASPASIAQAIRAAIIESNLNPSEVAIDGESVLIHADDEDGVSFISDTNPNGNLSKGVTTPISVTVSGSGVLEAWIDFNADGDWNDPGEQIIGASTPNAVFSDTGQPFTRVFNVTVPDFATPPPVPTTTYARFRISRDGGLGPNGLALSGEVEDYPILIQSGLPPQIGLGQQTRVFNVQEDVALLVLDATGAATPNADDNGLLSGITDPNGDPIAIYSEDVGVRTLTTLSGELAGELDLARDGTFTFLPAADFNGVVSFSARVTDLKPLAPETELVNSTPVRVTINVQPVNDPPIAVVTPVEVSVRTDEDTPITFTRAQLIDPFFVPGPANELGQPMLIQSVGSSNGPFTTELGGQVFISSDGFTVTYTPPADFSSTTEQDRFTYTVADFPGPGQLSRVSATSGLVEILIDAVNDPPRAGDDTFATPENTPLTIPISGPTGILANDTPGPQDEIDQGQTVVFVSSDATTLRGGTVTRQGDNLIYTPAFQFSGLDQFNYVVRDNLGASTTATVRILVDDENDPPTFIGINGTPGLDSLSFFESKEDPQVFTYNLNSWFRDPEGEAMTFTATSSNSSTVLATVTGSTLRLELPSFKFADNITLTVVATDATGLATSQPIQVDVVNTPDPPTVDGSLGPINANEDTVIIRTLSDVFSDRDNDTLVYSVARLDNLTNPTTQQIANHPLVRTIEFIGDQMRILLQPNQFGSAEIEIAATDGTFNVSDSFSLTVRPVPDRPVAVADGYSVQVGSTLRVLDPQAGLLRNDFDVDGDSFSVDLANVVGPSSGTLSLNPNGTFVYTSVSAVVGQQDSFTYRVIDSTGLASDPVTVTIDVTPSRYQNPLPNLREDVNADGNITAIDALRIINFLDRTLVDGGANSVPVSEIGSPPPDYYDTSGDGRISAQDALIVINKLGTLNNSFENESIVNLAVTTGFASASSVGLPVRNLELASTGESSEEDSLDLILAGGVEITSAASFDAAEWIAEDRDEATAQSVDEALALLMDEISLD